MGGGGRGCVAMGTHPMAAARANGSHAATEAMLCGAMVPQPASAASLRTLTITLALTTPSSCEQYTEKQHQYFGRRNYKWNIRENQEISTGNPQAYFVTHILYRFLNSRILLRAKNYHATFSYIFPLFLFSVFPLLISWQSSNYVASIHTLSSQQSCFFAKRNRIFSYIFFNKVLQNPFFCNQCNGRIFAN
jgi:hypothetical protein